MSNSSGNIAFTIPAGGAGISSITKTTLPIPKPQLREVLVRIHAVSLNYRDFAITAGYYPLKLKENLVLGSDMAGEVIEIGEGVEDWQVGDRVTANFDIGHLYGARPKRRSSSFLFRSVWHR